jgi:hypothetical protein
MPYDIIKKPSGKFVVINKLTGEIHAKGTTLKKAKAQIRLLNNLEGGGRKRIEGSEEERKERKRERERQYMNEYRHSMTEEQRQRERENKRQYRHNMTEEQRQREREIDRERQRQNRRNMTEEQRQITRENQRQIRLSRTEEQKEEQRQKHRQYMNEYRHNMTEEEQKQKKREYNERYYIKKKTQNVERQILEYIASNDFVGTEHGPLLMSEDDTFNEIVTDPIFDVDITDNSTEGCGRRPLKDKNGYKIIYCGGGIIQPVNHKPDYKYCCGSGIVRPINRKFLPFF